LVPVAEGAGRVRVTLVDADTSVAVQVPALLHSASRGNEGRIHGREEGGPTGLEEDESGSGRLVIAVVGVVPRILALRNGEISGCADGELRDARTGPTRHRGVCREQDVGDNLG